MSNNILDMVIDLVENEFFSRYGYAKKNWIIFGVDRRSSEHFDYKNK